MNRTKITVLGAGSWGIALANHYQRLGHQVTIWGNELAVLEEVAKTGVCQRYFPGTVGLSGIISETDLLAALESASLVVVALPSSAIRQVLTGVRLAADSVIVSASKGLEPGTHLRMSQVIEQSLLSENAVVVLTGPSFAFEVLTGMPTAVTVASKCPEAAQQVQSLTHAERFRVYLTEDLVGVELGGALKNVLAIAAGVVDGAKLGFNARAALLTRGISELQRLVAAGGGKAETVVGLSGLGDLMLTATSDLSRNRRVGLALGRGGDLKSVQAEIGQVTEGVNSARQAVELGDSLGVTLPICAEVLALLEGRKALQECIDALLARAPKRES